MNRADDSIFKINPRRRAGTRPAAVLLDDRLPAVRDFEARLDAEVGAGDVAFAPEEGEGVGLAVGEAQGVEHDLAGYLIVGAAEIERELVVDEDPDIVVADEGEDVARVVLELQVE